MTRADSALRVGDWEGFGRAYRCAPAGARRGRRRCPERCCIRPMGRVALGAAIHRTGAIVNLHEYQARGAAQGRRGPRARRRRGHHPGRGGGDRPAARRHGRDQGAGARRRSRQGGRREAGRDAGGGGRGAPRQILGMQIKGLTVHKVLVAPAADIASETYVGLIVDRESQRPVFMVSPAGGIDIEEVAPRRPRRSCRLPVDPRYGLLPHQALALAFSLYDDIAPGPGRRRHPAEALPRLLANGASLAEINPLVITPGRRGPGARRQGRRRRQRARPASRPRRAARRGRRGPERGRGAPRRASPSSSSTATSAASSTAPAWPWPPWTW